MADKRVVVLLRAVNLGGTNKVPMARLRQALTAAGAEDVSTFIASGNVICVPPGKVSVFADQVEALVAKEFGVTTDAILRDNTTLSAAREAYPFDVHDPKLCAIAFLKDKPATSALRELRERDLGADRCELIGRDLHLRYEDGVHGSKLTPAFLAKALGTPATARNLRTVERLIDLSA